MLPSSFETFFTPVKNTHNHETKSTKLNFQVLRTNTVTYNYGTNSIKSKIISVWNNIIEKLDIKIEETTKTSLKKKLLNYFLNKYKK